ncbi:MAG: hypothetical protein ABI569_04985, partial [Casimicrobiaceae bacterium]
MSDSTIFIGDPSRSVPTTAANVFPSQRKKPAVSQESSRTAVCTIALNTGRTSVGEPLITRRMSALAVWWLSACCVS